MSKLSPTPHHPDKGWRFSKGKIERNGKAVQFQRWLAPPKASAQIGYDALDLQWSKMQLDGRNLWTAEDVAAALQTASPQPQQPTPKAEPKVKEVFVTPKVLPQHPDASKLTLHQALDQYSDNQDALVKDNRMTPDHAFTLRHRMQSVKRIIPDCPLHEVRWTQLQKFKGMFTSRPLSAHARDPKPIAIDTVDSYLDLLGQAFKWFAKTDRWEPHQNFRDDVTHHFCLTKSERKRMLLPGEKLRKVKPTFNLEHLKTLYALGTDGQRLHLMMGLWFGWTQSQISALKKDELTKENGQYYINCTRTKTDVEGRWWVYPELAQTLIRRREATPDNPDNLALLTANGLPLVHRSKKSRKKTDTVVATYRGLRLRAVEKGVPNYPFSRLRKCGSQFIRNLAFELKYDGRYLAQLFLAHVSDEKGEINMTISDENYNGPGVDVGVGRTDFQKLEDVQRLMYEKAIQPILAAAIGVRRDSWKAAKPKVAEPVAA